MPATLAPVSTLEATALSASEGGALLSLNADPRRPWRHVAWVERDGTTLRVALDEERQTAEVLTLPRVA